MNGTRNKKQGLVIDGTSALGEYSVVWNIDVDADNPKEACIKAIEMLKEQLKAYDRVDFCPTVTAPVFEVVDCYNNVHVVDFEEEE